MPVDDASDNAAVGPKASPTGDPAAAPDPGNDAPRVGRRRVRSAQPERDMRPLLFDPDWYLRQHEDVARARLDPVQHYLDHGAGEGRNPNPFFDTRRYLAANADVRASPLNPFLHFVLYGFHEGRDPCPPTQAPADGESDRAPPRTMTGATPAEAPAEEKLRRTLLAAMFAAAAETGDRSNATPAAPARAAVKPSGASRSGARKKPRPV